jgi:hypothetical protein
VANYPAFGARIRRSPMYEDLFAIWERYKPQCDKRSAFSGGRLHGCMVYVPVACAEEAFEVVRQYFSLALVGLTGTTPTWA